MKTSKYNVFFKYRGKSLAFNGFTSSFAEVDEDFNRVIQNINSIDYDKADEKTKKLIDDMKMGFFLLDDDANELSLLKFNSNCGKFNLQGLGLTIAPTLACNFACPYCYENNQSGMIDVEVIDAIYKWVEQTAEKKEQISITWYGGEPLLAKSVIWEMSQRLIEICDKHKAPYSAYMISNGYLVDDDVVAQFKKAKITGVQITVDGPPQVHNLRRKLKNSCEPTFDTIISHIKLFENAGIHVGIRINIDKTNLVGLEELLDILIANELNKCDIGFGHVRDSTSACSSISDTCLTVQEYANESYKCQKILLEKGFNASDFPYYPSIKANYCCADSLTAFVVDPKGNLYKCWNDIGNLKLSVGNVKERESQKISNVALEYLLWSPFDKPECVSCEVLPICMGGCPYNGLKNKKPDCEKWRYGLIDVLKTRYDVYCMQGDENEEQSGDCCGVRRRGDAGK
ncbi:MAG: SPASM domain-containing protein [Oscillospiraceae bacterium]|nr:SPASM domain-containing protein [Oscillospiraceae bacterium]